MLVFDLNSLVTVLISRKLGSLCNVTGNDLQIEENLPNLNGKTPILESAMFNTNDACFGLDDPEFFFAEISETISHVIVEAMAALDACEVLPLKEEMIEITNRGILKGFKDVYHNQEIAVKFTKSQISFELCMFIQENLLSIEGLKIEDPLILILFATIWQTLSTQVQVSTDVCEPYFLLAMKLFSINI